MMEEGRKYRHGEILTGNGGNPNESKKEQTRGSNNGKPAGRNAMPDYDEQRMRRNGREKKERGHGERTTRGTRLPGTEKQRTQKEHRVRKRTGGTGEEEGPPPTR